MKPPTTKHMPGTPAGIFLVCLLAFSVFSAVFAQTPSITYEQALTLLKSSDLGRRIEGAEAMGISGDKRAGQSLLELLEAPDTDGVLKISAAYALGILGDQSVIPNLIYALEREYIDRTGIWSGIIPALGELGNQAAIPVLLQALNNRNDDWMGREMAAVALGKIGSADAVPALLDAAWMADTREAAMGALAAIGDFRAIPVFLSALQNEEGPETVAQATRGLRKLGDQATQELIKAFSPYSAEFKETIKRIRICRLLGERSDQRARDALALAARRDADARVQACAKEQLGNGN